MDKLTLDDIKLKPPGKQVKEAVLEHFEDLDSFASAIGMERRTLRQYLHERRLGSDTFKIRLSRLLDKGIDEIVKSDKEQIKEKVAAIHEGISIYKSPEDLQVLTKLKDLCVKYNLYSDIAKMQRNLAMYHFYRNNIAKAMGLMESAIDTISNSRYVIRWKSELGLMYFYKCEYKESKRFYDEVGEVLSDNDLIDDATKYLHYYRYGILQNNTNHPALAQPLFEKSLEYAETNTDKGDSIMNIGISFERRKKYKKAIEYYRKSLDFYDDDLNQSLLFNNLAVVYRLLKEYDKALYYVNLALSCVSDEHLSYKIVYYQTYVQILINKDEAGEAIGKLIEIIDKTEEKFVYKKFIIGGINTIIEYGWTSSNINILEDVDEIVYKLIKSTSSDNKEYIQELKTCLGDIRFYTKEIKKHLLE